MLAFQLYSALQGVPKNDLPEVYCSVNIFVGLLFLFVCIFSCDSSSIPRLVTDGLTDGAKLGQSYTTKGIPHIETWGLHKDINDNDNNDGDDNNDENDNNNDDSDNKGNSALGLDRSQGFSQGHQRYQ